MSTAALDVPLAPLTTLGLGGPARRLVEVADEAELCATVLAADAAGEPVLVLGGGSNVVVADAGFDGTVIRISTRGIARLREGDDVVLEVAAGEPWDALVASAVADGLAGIECLAGIPGLTGATPIQNVGAYGQDVAQTITAVRVLDREDGAVREFPAAACGFRYRSSAFKGHARYVVLGVTFRLRAGATESEPIAYAELARTLGVEAGARAPLAAARDAVLKLRRGKGMVLDPEDPDTRSAGSFFTNPILDAGAFATLAARVTERLGPDVRPPAFPEADGRTKTSAAWLIDRAGFGPGTRRGRVAQSSKHALALTNRGGATTAELVALAREIAAAVDETFGVALHPEPVFVGHRW
ncbi:MAG: UDP-N-acetylmuramate dehydrogenase [Solirubrobacteraceae bacterium]|nr:UDP-N-acetylmuramate dehydrogenase [Solirubrobacteraceae bacterium]